MTNKTFHTLKAGQQVTFTQDPAVLAGLGIPRDNAGKTTTVVKTNFENNEITIKCLVSGSNLYANEMMFIDREPGKMAKAPRFSRKDVEEIARKGSNTLLATEMATRLNMAKNHIVAAIKPEDFHKNLKLSNEQIRQARLIHSGIKK